MFNPIASALIASGVAAFIPLSAQAQTASPDRFDFEHVSCKGEANEIRIIITNVKKAHGLITVDLFPNKQEGFLRGRGRIKQISVAAKAPETKLCLTAPESGLFAMSAYHDRNANTDFDKTGLGLPDEPWAISNGPKVRFSIPPIEKALFEVTTEGATVEMKLK